MVMPEPYLLGIKSILVKIEITPICYDPAMTMNVKIVSDHYTEMIVRYIINIFMYDNIRLVVYQVVN